MVIAGFPRLLPKTTLKAHFTDVASSLDQVWQTPELLRFGAASRGTAYIGVCFKFQVGNITLHYTRPTPNPLLHHDFYRLHIARARPEQARQQKALGAAAPAPP